MTAIATVTGKVIDFLNPDPEQLSLDDIARGLSRAPRYAGQTDRPYSVLQHSLLVAHLVPAEHRLHALLHDAPEAYLCDVPSPAKEAMRLVNGGPWGMSAYDALEEKLWLAMCRRWDISPKMPDAVKEADRQAMAIEAPELQPEAWHRPIWDFARTIPVPQGAVHYLQALLLETQHDAAGRWLEAVAHELTVRRRAA